MKYQLMALALGAVAFSSCKKDEPEIFDPAPIEEMEDRSFTMEIEHAWGDQTFDMDANYELSGIAVKFTDFKFYMSNLKAIADMGATMESFDKTVLVDASQPFAAALGDVEMSHVHMLDFAIGLDEVANHAEDPASLEAPLNDISMHWNWNPMAGYKFILIEGFYDSDGDNEPDEFFAFHVAKDTSFREGSIEIHQDIDDEGNTVVFSIDYAAFFNGISFAPPYEFGESHGDGNIPQGIATNAVDAISVQ